MPEFQIQRATSENLAFTLHCGGHQATREQVLEAPVPPAIGRYVPVPHESFIERTEKLLSTEGFNIQARNYALAKEGARLFALWKVELPSIKTSDYSLVVGGRNSYDKSFSVSLCAGENVFMCDNLAMSAELKVSHRHTKNVGNRFGGMMLELIEQLPTYFLKHNNQIEKYKNARLTDKEAWWLVGQNYHQGVYNATDIKRVWENFKNPREEYVGPLNDNGGLDTVWAFYNAVTEELKDKLWDIPAKTSRLAQVIDIECSLN